jgi:hypothetical protein
MNRGFKSLNYRWICGLTTLAIACTAVCSIKAASMGLIKIRVEETSNKDRRNSNNLNRNNQIGMTEQDRTRYDSVKEVSETRSMRITITNQSNKPVEKAKVKYWLFGRDLESRKGMVLASGEQAITLPGLGSTFIEGKPINLQSKEAKRNNQYNTGSGHLGSIRSEKTGTDYAGYGVVVISSDGKILAEDFTAGSMRNLVARELPVEDNSWGLRK